MSEPFIVYRNVGARVEADKFGTPVVVALVEMAVLSRTGRAPGFEEIGFCNVVGAVHVDTAGRTFVRVYPTEWGGSPGWHADGAGVFYNDPPDGPVRLLDGTPLSDDLPTTPTEPAVLRAYRLVDTLDETCAYGCAHRVGIYEVLALNRTGRPFIDPVTGEKTGEIYTDNDGTEHTVSVGRGTSRWFARRGRLTWSDRVTPHNTLARDTLGNPLTAMTPPAPSVAAQEAS